jgi:glycosyltransferase involved in cell wall biosynthesis
VLDTGEARIPLVRAYVQLFAPLITRLAHGFVIHSEYDRKILRKQYDLDEQKQPVALIPHGPYSHYQLNDEAQMPRNAPTSCCNLLFFGVIRPFKGLEDLITAFNTLPEGEISKYWLTIVGETWEGWTLPAELIEQSPYHNRITFINRYVSDTEVAQFFAEADAMVLPYHRSSTSGPLHIAMSCGLPVVVTHVGGLVEAVANYDGAILVPPRDLSALRNALPQLAELSCKRYKDPHSWEHTATRYHALFNALDLLDNSVSPESKELSHTAQRSN